MLPPEREERERLEQEQREEEEREYQERLRKLEEQERKQRARQQEIEERERRREEERRGPTEEKAKVQTRSFFLSLKLVEENAASSCENLSRQFVLISKFHCSRTGARRRTEDGGGARRAMTGSGVVLWPTGACSSSSPNFLLKSEG